MRRDRVNEIESNVERMDRKRAERRDKVCERWQNGKLDGDVKVQDRVRGQERR